MDGASSKDQTHFDTCKRGPTLIKLVGYEHREDGVGEAGNVKHTPTQCPRDTQGEWNLGQRAEAILTHVSVAPHYLN